MPRSFGEVPRAHRHEEGSHEQRHAVDHGGVDDLSFPGLAGRQHGRHHAEGQQHPAPAEVGHQVERRGRRLAGAADVGEGARHRRVGDVVAGLGRVRPLLPPPGHAAVDEARVAVEARRRPDAQPFGHAGPEPLDQHVGLGREAQHDLDPVGVLEVDRDRAATPVQHVEAVEARPTSGPVDPHDVGAEIGEHHRRERRRPDARQLDDPHAVERPAHRCEPSAARMPPSATSWRLAPPRVSSSCLASRK